MLSTTAEDAYAAQNVLGLLHLNLAMHTATFAEVTYFILVKSVKAPWRKKQRFELL